MRLFYTLVTSGFLILTEIPTEVSPPYLSYPQYADNAITYIASVYGKGTKPSVDYVPDAVAARQPVDVAVARPQESEAVMPAEIKATAIPLPPVDAKIVTADSALATYSEQSALPITGFAMFYNPNVMQEVLNNRMRMGHVSLCPECVGNVALLRAGDLNRRVWLQWPDGMVEGPFLVADVAAKHHVAQLLARNWVVDVDNRTAVRHKMAGPVMVTVFAAPPINSTEDSAPFAPLYSTLPIHLTEDVSRAYPAQTPVPTSTPSPVINATSIVEASMVEVGPPQAGFPTYTPPPTLTPQPVMTAGLLATVAVMPGTFPVDTPVPTITPLPALNMAPISNAGATGNAVPVVATATPTATSPGAQSERVVVPQQGFPADTPVPTITPLPAISALPSATPIIVTN